MAVKLKIKKGDLVEILSGKDKGKQGASSKRARARVASSSRT